MFLAGFSLDSPGVGAIVLVFEILLMVAFYMMQTKKSAKEEAAPAPAPVAPVPAIDEEAYAVLLAAISEEARLSGEEFRVVSITEL